MKQRVEVRVRGGVLRGVEEGGLRVFRGVPYARPPVGDLRWRAPEREAGWEGVREAVDFGARPMQLPLFGDMSFRSAGMSEDCLFLNIWVPEGVGEGEGLPVLVYFYGGGFQAGDSSEPRYDGGSMARRGIVVVTVNYRLGVFGFLAHRALGEESEGGASGNYGLMDQVAAMEWVRENIGFFGGDSGRVTIGGESAGSISVSAHMVSPLSRGLYAGVLGESGSLLGTMSPVGRGEAELRGEALMRGIGVETAEAMRGVGAEELLRAAGRPGVGWFGLTLDGYFFREDPLGVFEAGRQERVPLLAGWNSEEMHRRTLMGGGGADVGAYEAALRRLYGDAWRRAWEVYDPAEGGGVERVATDLAGDRFIGHSTWRWLDRHGRTGGCPVYRYYFTRMRPSMRPELGEARSGFAGGVIRGKAGDEPMGAVHSAEIEYALGNLEGNRVYAWEEEDYAVSRVMQGYFERFIRSGNPNGGGGVEWPAANAGGGVRLMRLDVEPGVEVALRDDRYRFLDGQPFRL